MDRRSWLTLREAIAEAFPSAIVNLISDEPIICGDGAETTHAIEMSPVERCLNTMPAPTAKWTVVLWNGKRKKGNCEEVEEDGDGKRGSSENLELDAVKKSVYEVAVAGLEQQLNPVGDDGGGGTVQQIHEGSIKSEDSTESAIISSVLEGHLAQLDGAGEVVGDALSMALQNGAMRSETLTVNVAILKMGRQIVDQGEFLSTDIDSVIQFLSNHPFLSGRHVFCRGIDTPGGDDAVLTKQPFAVDFFGGVEVKRSRKCELVIPRDSDALVDLCDFCHALKVVVDAVVESELKAAVKTRGIPVGRKMRPKRELVEDDEDDDDYDPDEDYVPTATYRQDDQDDLDDDEDFAMPHVKVKQEIREGNGGDPSGDSDYDPSKKPKKEKSGDVKPLACKLCGKIFTKKGFLLRHMRLHKKEQLGGDGDGNGGGDGGAEEEDIDENGEERFAMKRPYKPETRSYHCHLCGVVISRASKYYHMKYVHKIGFEIFKCFCGKEYSSKLGLKKHHLSHTGERPFICSYCGKTFRDNASFNDCQRRCSGKDMYECKTCGKKYPRKERYVIHLRSHTGEKPFSCPLCKFACNRKSNLTAHVKRAHQKTLSEIVGKQEPSTNVGGPGRTPNSMHAAAAAVATSTTTASSSLAAMAAAASTGPPTLVPASSIIIGDIH